MGSDWSRYWRSGDGPLEAMYAHFQRHAYHRHSHETYSFGVTEDGVQSFHCRGSAHASAAGMIMAFNPDDPHDGQACDELGFTYRMVHVGPELVSGVLGDITGRPAGLPLFADPVVSDPVLAGRLRGLHRALLAGATALRRDELLAATISSIVRRAAASARPPAAAVSVGDGRSVARRARQLIRDSYLDDITAADLAAATGRSRFTVHRVHVGVRDGARRLPAPAPAPRRTAADRAGASDQRGRRPGRLQRPGSPHPLVHPLLRHHPGRLPACRAVRPEFVTPWFVTPWFVAPR